MSKTKYQLIADEIRSRIFAKEYKVGEGIPTESQLQKEFDVSRHTVRQAIALLVNEGHLRSEKGSGTYVQDSHQKKPLHAQKTIGVITTYMSDYIFPAIIRGIEQTLRENGYGLLLASTNNDLEQEKKCLEMMLNQGVSGLIVEPTKSNQYNPNLSHYLTFKERQIPVVMLNAFYEELDFPYIATDDVASGYLATNYLINKGHKQLSLVTKIDDLQGKLRMKGFINAHADNKLTFDSENIFTYTTETMPDVVEKVVAKISRTPNFTGIVSYNDEVASMLVNKMVGLGLRIPENYSIIGHDDSSLSLIGQVQLTSISHPKEILGEEAAKQMIAAIEQHKPIETHLYTPRVIERQSVKLL